MSKINIEQISDSEVEVTLHPDTPMELVQELTKGLIVRGLVEDLAKSTVSTRYFYRPQDRVNDLADKLIKSLSNMTKDDGELPYWHPKAQFANQVRNKAIDRQVDVVRAHRRLIGKDPSKIGVANVNMPKPKAPVAKGEVCEECKKDPCVCDVEKSGYGPKGSGQYSTADNARRKMKNVETVEGAGPNNRVKQYHSATFAGRQGYQTDSKLKKPQPVKNYSPEEKQALASKMGLKKSWINHNSIPNAEEEMAKLERRNPVNTAEDLMAGQLRDLMLGRAMLGQQPPPQPTDEQMFGGGVVTEEMAKSAEHQWNNMHNNFYAEATKPISQRFASEEEELAYWDSIKVSDRDDGQPGY